MWSYLRQGWGHIGCRVSPCRLFFRDGIQRSSPISLLDTQVCQITTAAAYSGRWQIASITQVMYTFKFCYQFLDSSETLKAVGRRSCLS